MELKKCVKEAFAVIGKEGSADSGEGFVQILWEDANSHFNEIQHLAKKDSEGNIVGIWGAMSDFSHSFMPWENGFTRGLYLAGVECDMTAEAPDGWTKWVVPGYEYLYTENGDGIFPKVIEYFQENDIGLAGAVHDFTDPKTGKGYMFFPIKRI